MRKIILKIIFLALLLPCHLLAQDSGIEISGYIKHISSLSDYPGVKDTLYDQLVHARVDTAWYPSDSLRGEMGIRVRGFYGNSFVKIPRYREEIKIDYDFTNLDAVLWDSKKSMGYGQIDRLWMGYTKKDLEVTVGRQRIAWGTSLVWNVIDLFNPKSVLDYDYEEKPGTDAIRMQYYTGAVSKVEISVRPGKDSDHYTAAGLYSVNISGYDLFGIAGIRNNQWVAGGAWAGAISDGGFRGEFLISQSLDRTPSRDHLPAPVTEDSLFESTGTVASFVLSGDYTFASTFYIHTECLYNSNGKTENAGLFQQEAAYAGMLSPAQWSIYQEFAYDLTPLTRATLFGFFNPNDHSFIIVPMLSRSVTANMDLLLIGFLPSGRHNTEFGIYGKSINLRLKYSF